MAVAVYLLVKRMPDDVDFGDQLGDVLKNDLSPPERTPESLLALCQARDTPFVDEPVALAASFLPKPNRPIMSLPSSIGYNICR